MRVVWEFSSSKGCRVKFGKVRKTIFQISQLSTVISGEGSVFIPDRGWFIFGGHDRLLKDSATFAQRLADLDAKWERGPSLYMPYADSTKCVIQVKGHSLTFRGKVTGGNLFGHEHISRQKILRKWLVHLPKLFLEMLDECTVCLFAYLWKCMRPYNREEIRDTHTP